MSRDRGAEGARLKEVSIFGHEMAMATVEKEGRPNQDGVFMDRAKGVVAVFDGMGGKSQGEEAAKTAVRTLTAWTEIVEPIMEWKGAGDWLERVLIAATNRIQVNEDIREGGATASVVKFLKFQEERKRVVDAIGVVNEGDSRVYVYSKREQKLKCLTIDDGPSGNKKAQDFLSNVTSEADFNNIRDVPTRERLRQMWATRNLVRSRLGGYKHRMESAQLVSVGKGDIVLVCSDGLSNLTDKEIEDYFKDRKNGRRSAQDLASGLVGKAHEVSLSTGFRRKPDDITAVVVRVG